MATKQPSPVSRQSTVMSKTSYETRKSIVSVSGINVDTGSLTTLPASVESPEPPMEEYNPMLNGVKKQLLTAARKCDTNTIVKLLDEWKNLNLNFADESGKTLLHLCANAGNKNDVGLLLQRNCPVNRLDNMGHTPLHYVAKKDYVDIAEMLVVNGALLDLPEEKTGQTALHFAVAKNFVATVEFLVFSGASILLKDRNNRTPIALCRSKEIYALLSAATQSSGGTRPGEMSLQTVEVQGGGITECWKLGLTIDYSTGPAEDKFSLMCRRQTTDESDLDFVFEETEDICSDAFQYRLGRTGKPTVVRLTVPIFNAPKPKEELVLKTEKGHQFSVVSVNKVETDTPYCVVNVDMSKFQSFIILCRPKTDIFTVPKEGGTFSSKVNSKIGLTIQADTFSTEVKLVLQAFSPSDALGSDGMKDICSATPFSSLKAENMENPKKSIQVRVPTPQKYGSGKELKLFVADVVDAPNIDNWSSQEDTVVNSQDVMTFESSTRAMNVVIETTPNVEMSMLKPQVGMLFRKSTRKEYSVVFITMTKHDQKNNTFKTVIECNTSDNMSKAKKKWLSDGFIDQKPNDTPCFNGTSRQRYKVTATRNLRPQGAEDGFMIIQFHPKRHNFTLFTTGVKKDVSKETGSVQISEYNTIKMTAEELDSVGPKKPEEKLLTNIQIAFGKTDKEPTPAPVPTIQVQEPSDLEGKKVKIPPTSVPPKATPPPAPVVKTPAAAPKTAKYVGGKGSDKSFTNDEFLYSVVKELDDEWYKIVVMMGWNFTEVEKVLQEPNKSQQEKIMHFFLQWRENNRNRDDLGMPVLLTAFAKGGRRDLCTVVSLMMREWYDMESNQKHKFWKWVQKAFKDSDLINPGDYPKPMSDQFLLLLAQSLNKPNLDIAKHLDITTAELDKVKNSNTSDELKMLKILLEGRNGAQSHLMALRKLLDAMITLDMGGGVRWTMVASRQWLEVSSELNTQFTGELHDILFSYGKFEVKTSNTLT